MDEFNSGKDKGEKIINISIHAIKTWKGIFKTMMSVSALLSPIFGIYLDY